MLSAGETLLPSLLLNVFSDNKLNKASVHVSDHSRVGMQQITSTCLKEKTAPYIMCQKQWYTTRNAELMCGSDFHRSDTLLSALCFYKSHLKTQHGTQPKCRIMYRMLFTALGCFLLRYEALESHKFTLISALLPPHMLRTLLPMEQKHRQD